VQLSCGDHTLTLADGRTLGYFVFGDPAGLPVDVTKIGVEGTGSYGSGLARYLRRVGVEVLAIGAPAGECRPATLLR